jgi:hypothetical protein
MGTIEHRGRNRQGMNMQEKRSIALGAVRSQLRHMEVSIDRSVPFNDVLCVLDDLQRAEPDLIASQWYVHASDYQITLLRRDCNRQFAPTRRTARQRSM